MPTPATRRRSKSRRRTASTCRWCRRRFGSTAMTSERDARFGFAPADDAPIRYLERIRDYYQALGYGAPYEWAHYADVPFHRLDKPLAEARVTIVTTAAPYRPDKGDQGPG